MQLKITPHHPSQFPSSLRKKNTSPAPRFFFSPNLPEKNLTSSEKIPRFPPLPFSHLCYVPTFSVPHPIPFPSLIFLSSSAFGPLCLSKVSFQLFFLVICPVFPVVKSFRPLFVCVALLLLWDHLCNHFCQSHSAPTLTPPLPLDFKHPPQKLKMPPFLALICTRKGPLLSSINSKVITLWSRIPDSLPLSIVTFLFQVLPTLLSIVRQLVCPFPPHPPRLFLIPEGPPIPVFSFLHGDISHVTTFTSLPQTSPSK